MTNTFNFKITVGDYSRDGHNQFEDFIISCNKDKKTILRAYNKFCKRTKIALTDLSNSYITLCREYEDSSIPLEVYNSLLVEGIKFPLIESIEEDTEDVLMGPCSIVTLFLEMVRVELKDFEYSILEFETLIQGIGYGCFN